MYEYLLALLNRMIDSLDGDDSWCDALRDVMDRVWQDNPISRY